MTDLDIIEGTGAELRAHLRRYPQQRFRLVPISTERGVNGAETGSTPDADTPRSGAEPAIDALSFRGPLASPKPDGWLTTIGMFEDDPLIDEIDAASIRLRNEDFSHE